MTDCLLMLLNIALSKKCYSKNLFSPSLPPTLLPFSLACIYLGHQPSCCTLVKLSKLVLTVSCQFLFVSLFPLGFCCCCCFLFHYCCHLLKLEFISNCSSAIHVREFSFPFQHAIVNECAAYKP